MNTHVTQVDLQGRDPADAFVDFVHDAMSSIRGVEIELAPMDYRDVSLERLFVVPTMRRCGIARSVMARLVELADEWNVNLSLSAIPLERRDANIEAGDLVAFYEEYGFRIDEGDVMLRPARAPAARAGSAL